MPPPEPKEIRSATLRDLIREKDEQEYMLIDVRQPQEYSAAHIPGAIFLPLLELEKKLFDLPADRDLIFYCHSGGRSRAAAFLAAEAEVTSKEVFNLAGGILAWQEKKLSGFPRVQVFEADSSPEAMLFSAMDLEKGAWRFYRAAVEKTSDGPLLPVLSKLAEAETAHALAVYNRWAPLRSASEPFSEVFGAMAGDILEGGESVEEAIDRLEALGHDPCLNLIEIALDIEYRAYELYRTMAENAAQSEAKDAFFALAQAEKAHMRVLGRAVKHCTAEKEGGSYPV